MHELNISADDLIAALLRLSETETVCILDSCGVGHLGSHLLIAGIDPVQTLEVAGESVQKTFGIIDENLSGDLASIFTLSYDFGLKLSGLQAQIRVNTEWGEPDIFLALFDSLVIHDYDNGKTILFGEKEKVSALIEKLKSVIYGLVHVESLDLRSQANFPPISLTSSFTKPEYLAAVENIKERIRIGDTYQTNLTQQLSAVLPHQLSPQQIFFRLRRDHPAPFSAFIKRPNSTVVSNSPERFFRTDGHRVTTSPIKGTRPRGNTSVEDGALKRELLTSEKDIAENTMIVDLLRNDLGRVCEYGSVRVERLCDIEEHPTLFHLVSTVSGELHKHTKPSEILSALFPCGSITGAPKMSTMTIIDEIETVYRGLSMGAIGVYIPRGILNGQGSMSSLDFGRDNVDFRLDLSVAIRTMVIRDNVATFNVGGGIVIDSDAETEYDETLTKAKAMLAAIGGKFP